MDPVAFPAPDGGDPTALYLDLVKRCLLNWVYADLEPGASPDAEAARVEGRDWPPTAHTMIGLARLDNLRFTVKTVPDLDSNQEPGREQSMLPDVTVHGVKVLVFKGFVRR